MSAPVQTGPGAHLASYTMGTIVQVGSNMTGIDLCVNKPQSVPVIFQPPCIRPGHGVDLPPPFSAEVNERVELYLYT